MTVTKTLFSFLMLVLTLFIAAPASAQRPVPGNNGDAPFVEQADPGSFCPSCQVLVLRDSYAPPEHVNVYAPAGSLVTRIKPTADFVIYDGSNGFALIVKTTPNGYVPGGFSVLSIWENVQWAQLRPGMFWTVGDIDGDGRDDLSGHDKRTGEIVRVYRRGPR
jgi:hypothetical protein